MKFEYIKPSVKLEEFETIDVITTSENDLNTEDNYNVFDENNSIDNKV